MEFAGRGQPITAAADDVGNRRLRRFPDLTPPQPHGHGDANASSVDAALLTRRDELLWEFQKGRIRQDMILRDLVETERALGFTAAGHNPVPALPWSQDDRRSRTPSVLPWEEAPPRLPGSGAQHPPCCCGGGSSASTAARAAPMYPRVETSPSPPRLLQLQSVTDTEKQQDCMSSGARTHPASGHVALCAPLSKRTLEEETSIPVALAPNAIVRSIRPGSIHEELASTYQRTHDRWERKAAVEDGHGVQALYEGTNRKRGERGDAEFSRDKQIVEAVQWPFRYSLAGKENAASYQQKRLEFSEPPPEQTRPGNNTEQHQEGMSSWVHPFSGYMELCRSPSNQTPVEETLVPVAAKVGIRQMPSAPFCGEARSWHQQSFIREKVDVEDGHGIQPLHEIKNQSNEEWKARQGLQYKPANKEKAANNEQKRTEFNEPSPGRAFSGVKRKLTAASPPPVIVKKPKPPGQWRCDVCQANPHSQRQLDEHLAGKRHQANVAAALQASRSSSPAPAPNTRAEAPARSRATARNAAESPSPSPPRRDGNEEASEKRWTCWVCDAKCTCQSDYFRHFGGRRHREKAEEVRRAVLARFHCAVCDVQCNSEKMLASHLAGRRHREALEGSDSDSD